MDFGKCFAHTADVGLLNFSTDTCGAGFYLDLLQFFVLHRYFVKRIICSNQHHFNYHRITCITGLLGFFYFIYFRNPIGAIDIVATFVVIIKNSLSERKQIPNNFFTKILTTFVLTTMLLSLIFTVRIFVTNKQTGLSNGLSCSWSARDEKFFDELAKNCTTQEEIVLAGYEWIVENINYDYEYTAFYQYFDIEKTLYAKKGLCYDFTNLFTAYCRSQGIPCFAIDGKHQYDYSRKHTWNRVYFNGSWWDVDLTFDAVNKDKPHSIHYIDNFNDADSDYIITRIY